MNEKKHVVILGVNHRLPELINLLEKEGYSLTVISRYVSEYQEEFAHRADFVESDFLDRDVFLKHNISQSFAVLILAEARGLSARDTDARSVVATLSVESMNSEVRTIVEVLTDDSEYHLRNAGVDEIIKSGSLTADILAFSTNHDNFSKHLNLLLRFAHKNRIEIAPVTERYVGKELRKVVHLMASTRKILLTVRPEGNKDRETLDPVYVLNEADQLVYIDML